MLSSRRAALRRTAPGAAYRTTGDDRAEQLVDDIKYEKIDAWYDQLHVGYKLVTEAAQLPDGGL